MSNCQENTNDCSENNVGNFSVNEKSLIVFESIDENLIQIKKIVNFNNINTQKLNKLTKKTKKILWQKTK